MKHTLAVTCGGTLQMSRRMCALTPSMTDEWFTVLAYRPTLPHRSHDITHSATTAIRDIKLRSGTQPTNASPCFTVNSLDKYWERSLIYKDVCVVFGPGPPLIWYGDTQSFPLDLRLSAAVQRKHSLSQSDAVRSKPRDADGNGATNAP